MLKTLADCVFLSMSNGFPIRSLRKYYTIWSRQQAGATGQEIPLKLYGQQQRKEGDPPDYQRYLKTILCRIVSLAGILRESLPDGRASLKLVSLPVDTADETKSSEKSILTSFMNAVGLKAPVGRLQFRSG